MCERQKKSTVQTKYFGAAPFFCGISTETEGYNTGKQKKEGRFLHMKEFLYEIATFLLAAVQAFWLVWVTGGFVR